jgi:hypothetical protein
VQFAIEIVHSARLHHEPRDKGFCVTRVAITIYTLYYDHGTPHAGAGHYLEPRIDLT